MKPTVQYFVFLAVGLLGCAWLFSSLIEAWLDPDVNNNEIAYLALAERYANDQIDVLSERASYVLSIATDSDIKTVANFDVRLCAVAKSAGVHSTTEKGSAFVKSMLATLTSVDHIRNAADLLLFGIVNDVDGAEARVNQKYKRITSQHSVAHTIGGLLFYAILIGGPWFYVSSRERLEENLLEILFPITFLNLKQEANSSTGKRGATD